MKIGILSIATNVYVDYWKALALSIDSNVASQETIVMHVFTDQTETVNQFASELTRVEVMAHQIDALGWPDATLKRFEIFFSHMHLIEESILVYLDADMLVTKDFTDDVFDSLTTNSIALVAHPGYWRNSKFSNLSFSVGEWKTTLRSIRNLVLNRHQGTWEDNKLSQAFVPRSKRKHYVCGGTWMGRRKELFEMIQILKNTVEQDLSNGIVAKWHDESHLNFWASISEFKLLDPSFCFVKEYKHLSSLSPKIIAVTKDVKTR
jgi:hypothetical protein